jgi:hypothetical protein
MGSWLTRCIPALEKRRRRRAKKELADKADKDKESIEKLTVMEKTLTDAITKSEAETHRLRLDLKHLHAKNSIPRSRMMSELANIKRQEARTTRLSGQRDQVRKTLDAAIMISQGKGFTDAMKTILMDIGITSDGLKDNVHETVDLQEEVTKSLDLTNGLLKMSMTPDSVDYSEDELMKELESISNEQEDEYPPMRSTNNSNISEYDNDEVVEIRYNRNNGAVDLPDEDDVEMNTVTGGSKKNGINNNKQQDQKKKGKKDKREKKSVSFIPNTSGETPSHSLIRQDFGSSNRKSATLA